MSEAEQQNTGRTRSQLIQLAQANVHDARQTLIEAISEGNGASPIAVRELHYRVIEYYHALLPLADKSAVEDFWAECELWPVRRAAEARLYCPACEWVDRRSQEDSPLEADDICTVCGEQGLQVGEFPATDEYGRPEFEYARGLDTLEEYELSVQRGTRTVQTALGAKEEEAVAGEPLPPQWLLKASKQLDRAAGMLGFEPETSTPDAEDPAPI